MSLLLLFAGFRRLEIGGGFGAIPGGSGLSRKKWRELQDAKRAQAEAEQRAEELARSKQKTALASAAEVAAKAIEATAEAEPDAQAIARLQAMTSALEAAAGAKKVATIIAQAKAAEAFARQVMEELEDEEQAVMLLLQ
jgi:murein L,D-transpeptidase YcbB/YkuD